MLTEQCVACGADVPLSGAVHILVNPKEDEDVTDGYLCRACYEEHVEPILPPTSEEPVEGDGEGDDGRPGDDHEDGRQGNERSDDERQEDDDADDGTDPADGGDATARGA